MEKGFELLLLGEVRERASSSSSRAKVWGWRGVVELLVVTLGLAWAKDLC